MLNPRQIIEAAVTTPWDQCAFCAKQRNQVAGMTGSAKAPIHCFVCVECVELMARVLGVKVAA